MIKSDLTNILFAGSDGNLNGLLNQSLTNEGGGDNLNAQSFLALLGEFVTNLEEQDKAALLQQLEATKSEDLPSLLPLLNLNTEAPLDPNEESVQLTENADLGGNQLLSQILKDNIALQQTTAANENKEATKLNVDTISLKDVMAALKNELHASLNDSKVAQDKNHADNKFVVDKSMLANLDDALSEKRDPLTDVRSKMLLTKNQDNAVHQAAAQVVHEVNKGGGKRAAADTNPLDALLQGVGLNRVKLETSAQSQNNNSTQTTAYHVPLTQAAHSNNQVSDSKFSQLLTDELSIHAKLEDAAWSDEMSDNIMWMMSKNMNSAQIKINPPQLGPIDVRISVTNDVTNIQFQTQHAGVKEAIESAVPRLREMLSESGLNLANVNVSDQSTDNQRFAESKAQQDQQSEHQKKVFENLAQSSSEDDTEQGEASIQTRISLSKGLVDYYA